MTTDRLTKIITAAPSIRAELWQAVAAETIDRLATVTAERDAARAERDEIEAWLNLAAERLASLDAVADSLGVEPVNILRTIERVRCDIERKDREWSAAIDSLTAAEAERDAVTTERDALARRVADLRDGAHAERAELEAEVREIRAAMAKAADALGCGHDADAVVRAVADIKARPALTVERLAEAMAMGPGSAEFVIARLGPVTLPLPARDRAEDLIAAYVDEYAARYEAADNPPHMDRWHEASADRRRIAVETMTVALAKVGSPSPAADAFAPVDADALYARCEADFMGGHTGQMYDAFKHGMWTVCNVLRSASKVGAQPPAVAPGPDAAEFLIDKMRSYGWHFLTSPEAVPDMRRAIAAMPKPAPSPAVAPGPVLAGVSVEELHAEYERAGYGASGIRAVVARLGASLVAPVDPEAVARDYHDHDDAPVESWPIVVVDGDAVAGKAVRAMRATLAARGIPVTPEVGE